MSEQMNVPDDLKGLHEGYPPRAHRQDDEAILICALIERIDKLKAENAELARKGKDLCSAYGNALLSIGDLKRQVAAMTEAAKRLIESHCWDDGSVGYDGTWTECPKCKPLRDAINPPQQEVK